VSLDDLPAAIDSRQERQRSLEKEIASLRMKLASAGGGGTQKPEDRTVEVDGIRLLPHRVDGLKGGELRNLADTFRSRLGSGIVVIGSEHEGKATLLVAVTADVGERISARDLIDRLAPIVDGRGGGRADLAQAGGKAPEKIDEALSSAAGAVRDLLGAAVSK
jgi:alanyl-tRNA synthetase